MISINSDRFRLKEKNWLIHEFKKSLILIISIKLKRWKELCIIINDINLKQINEKKRKST